MRLTSHWGLKIVWWLSITAFSSSKPLPPSCMDTGTFDLLGIALAESSAFPAGVEITKENGISGYRFDPEARLLGVTSSEIMTRCNYFPQEFSIVCTFKRELRRNENEYLLTLLGQDRQTILIDIRLQRNNLHFDFINRTTGGRETASFQNTELSDGKWHTVIITVSKNQVHFTLDCRRTSTSQLESKFPKKLNIKGSRFYVASRRRKRNRFTGLLRQIQFVPGADASLHVCTTSHSSSFHSSFPFAAGSNIFSSNIGPMVTFDEGNELPNTCNTENKGQLMYRKHDGDLDMCEGEKWMRVATTKERLDYVTDFGDLMTKRKTLDIEVFKIPGEGLFLAAANQRRDRDMDSTIYKWKGVKKLFVPYQNINTGTARNVEYFTIGNEHFLAVANQMSSEAPPIAQRNIYRWNPKQKRFLPHQYIETYEARSWESFAIDGKYYLAVANYGHENDYRQKSCVYLWDPDQRIFVIYQTIDTVGAYDVEYFEVDGNHYLAIANSFDGLKMRMDSVIYQWRFSRFIALQYVETFGATDWEHFVISGRHFLAVANYYDDHRRTFAVNSYIFEYRPRINQFRKLQNIMTNGSLDFEFFTVGRDSYLMASSSTDEEENLTSTIYRWQGMEHFVPVHTISTRACADWESFKTDDGKYYLVSANIMSKSKLLHLVTY